MNIFSVQTPPVHHRLEDKDTSRYTPWVYFWEHLPGRSSAKRSSTALIRGHQKVRHFQLERKKTVLKLLCIKEYKKKKKVKL